MRRPLRCEMYRRLTLNTTQCNITVCQTYLWNTGSVEFIVPETSIVVLIFCSLLGYFFEKYRLHFDIFILQITERQHGI
jgi:hypothetical protein